MTTSESAMMSLLGFLGIAATVIMFYFLISMILTVIGRWMVFTKAGEAGWKALIPFYSDYILYRISWKGNFFFAAFVLGVASAYLRNAATQGNSSAFLSLLSAVVSIALLLLSIALDIHVADRFGKRVGFVVGLVLLGPLFMIILGFDSSVYLGNPDEGIPPQNTDPGYGNGL